MKSVSLVVVSLMMSLVSLVSSAPAQYEYEAEYYDYNYEDYPEYQDYKVRPLMDVTQTVTHLVTQVDRSASVVSSSLTSGTRDKRQGFPSSSSSSTRNNNSNNNSFNRGSRQQSTTTRPRGQQSSRQTAPAPLGPYR